MLTSLAVGFSVLIYGWLVLFVSGLPQRIVNPVSRSLISPETPHLLATIITQIAPKKTSTIATRENTPHEPTARARAPGSAHTA